MAAVCDGHSFCGSRFYRDLQKPFTVPQAFGVSELTLSFRTSYSSGKFLYGSRWICRIFREAKSIPAEEFNNGALLQRSLEALGTSGPRGEAQKKLVIPQEEIVERSGIAELSVSIPCSSILKVQEPSQTQSGLSYIGFSPWGVLTFSPSLCNRLIKWPWHP